MKTMLVCMLFVVGCGAESRTFVAGCETPPEPAAPDWCIEECRSIHGGNPIPGEAYCTNVEWSYDNCNCACDGAE